MKIITEYFLLAMFLTFIYLYLTQPKPKIIIKEPNVKDAVSDSYIDDNDVCYKYHRKEINCVGM